jgi:hypothetical protein
MICCSVFLLICCVYIASAKADEGYRGIYYLVSVNKNM